MSFVYDFDKLLFDYPICKLKITDNIEISRDAVRSTLAPVAKTKSLPNLPNLSNKCKQLGPQPLC